MAPMLLTILFMLTLVTPTQDPVAAALENYRNVTSYRVTLHSGDGDEAEVIRYFYKRPGFVRMEFVRPHKGALLVYDPGTKTIRLRPFSFFSPFVLTLSPDDSLVQSAQGHRVDASDIGAFLLRVKRLQEHGTTVIREDETVEGKSALTVSVKGKGDFAVEGVHQYLLWLDKVTMLPLKTAAYGVDGNLIEEVRMEGLELNVKLDGNFFKL